MKELAYGSILLVLSGCVSVTPLPPQPGGFDAIHFRETVQVRDHAVNTYTFQAGTVLVADRQTKEGLAYCGSAAINGTPIVTCIGFRQPSTIVIAPGAGFKEVERPISSESFERTKVQSRGSVKTIPPGM